MYISVQDYDDSQMDINTDADDSQMSSNTDEVIFDGTVNELENTDINLPSPGPEHYTSSNNSRKRKLNTKEDITNLIATATNTLQKCTKDAEEDDLNVFGR